MRASLFLILAFCCIAASAQELYVFSEPASNMPARSMSARFSAYFARDSANDRLGQRYRPEVMFGFSKKLMLHFSATFANMHSQNLRFESLSTYLKWRFYSRDDIHRHFRMALFADATRSRAPFKFNEISLVGDKSGVQAGLILTQLTNRLAVSGTLSHTQVFHHSRTDKVLYVPERYYQSFDYSVSAGYLVLPKEYTDYRQTNFNVYLEMLGQRLLDVNKHYLDLAPAAQFIFNSNLKLNVGYRFQLSSNMSRMGRDSWLISLERIFLGALPKKQARQNQ